MYTTTLMNKRNRKKHTTAHVYRTHSFRDAARFSNLGGQAVMRWAKSAPSPLVGIGLSETANSGWAKAHSAHPLAESQPDKLLDFQIQLGK